MSEFSLAGRNALVTGGRRGIGAPTALLPASAAGSYYVGQTLSPNGGDVMI